jgi:SAM-dependent methyltransferase
VGRLSIPSLSEAFIERVAAVSRAELGLDHLVGPRLAEGVAEVSRRYTLERAELQALQGDARLLSARLQFFLPRDLLKLHGPLSELASVSTLPQKPRWRVLDLGAGLGSTSLGVSRFAALSSSAQALDVTAVDVDAEALELFAALAADVQTLPGVPITLSRHVADLASWARAPARRGPYDLIVMGLVLNELSTARAAQEREEALLQSVLALAEQLDPLGSMIIIEPALRETSRVLHALRDRIAQRAASPYVFAPCLGPTTCPMLARPRDYCHERLPIELPRSLAPIAGAAGLRDRDLTYSYLTLTPSQRSLRELGSVGEQLYRVVSGQLASKGKTEAWLCGPNAAPRAQRLDRHVTDGNTDFELAERGCIIRVSSTAPATPSGMLRIDKSAEVQVLQRWEREQPEASGPLE